MMNREEQTRYGSRRRPQRRRSPFSTILTIFFIALAFAAVIIGALFFSGIRLIKTEDMDGGQVNFFGRIKENEPFDGTVYYSNGLTAKLNKAENTLTYSDGSVYTGEIKALLRHGKGEMKYANGDVYSGSFDRDIINGSGTFTFANGDSYVGELENGLKNGYGTYTWADGSTYSGLFSNDQRNGAGFSK
ncbi:MAG: hypothetical protein IJ303_00725, partial [Clostridia bacterium]|nr:hypothetical protein [Clostridia bacterium]